MIPRRIPPAPPGPITLPRVLLVEGDTPMHFCEALLRHLKLDDQIEVRNFRGVGDFKTFLVNLADTDAFKQIVTSVGIIRDAEAQPAAAARQSVTDALTAAGLTPSSIPPVRTSIFILPDDVNPGMIETLCMQAVGSEPSLVPIFTCVEDFFACLTQKSIPLPGLPVLAKNRAQVYLAAHKETQMFPGVAAYHDRWPWNVTAFDPLKSFLQNL
jgi:uncharacterized protein DUF3226